MTEFPQWQVVCSDVFELLAQIRDNSLDACVTDNPYVLSFMGKQWDKSGISFDVKLWREVLRVLKPGAHLIAFGAPRTHHRIWCAIEDAGFEIRDTLLWCYGTGFPKSVNIEFAIDEDLCQEPGRHYHVALPTGKQARDGDHLCTSTIEGDEHDHEGTGLKPAWEPICLARKPLEGTLVQNVRRWGTGVLNIDGCRIENGDAEGGDRRAEPTGAVTYAGESQGFHMTPGPRGGDSKGRWPANLLFDEGAARQLDEQTGELKAGVAVRRNGVSGGVTSIVRPKPPGTPDLGYGGSGGASRFFYITKVSKTEREAGLDELPIMTAGQLTDREDDTEGLNSPRAGAGRRGGRRNHHPTVKPIALMRWLVRLVAQPGQLAIDPFFGSGSTGIAALLEGVNILGGDESEAYCKISEKRLEHWEKTARQERAQEPVVETYPPGFRPPGHHLGDTHR